MGKENYVNSVNLNINTEFPYLVLDVVNDRSYPRNPGFQVMHWHEDLQFIYVIEGKVEVRTLDNSVQVQMGEGLYINKNVVHYVRRIGNCHYNSFIFPEYFLEFFPSLPGKAFVSCVTKNERLPFYHFSPGIQWQREVLEILRELTVLEKNKTELYVYEVLVRLSAVWLLMRRNISLPPEQKESPVHLRMQKILRFIQRHYTQDLTLEELAGSANISKSECSRCFKICLHTTPYKYLIEYRLSVAARLLKETEEPVGNIGACVGFHQMSHFGKCFKEKTGYSPTEYRKIEKRNRTFDV